MNLVFEDHHVFFLTPQILLNNIHNKRISLSDVTLLIFDECHHTRKREPYNNVMKQYLTMKRKEKKVPQVAVFTFISKKLTRQKIISYDTELSLYLTLHHTMSKRDLKSIITVIIELLLSWVVIYDDTIRASRLWVWRLH